MGHYESDRRRHKRVGVDKSILVKAHFTALDLSESGMRLLSKSEQRKGRELELDLKLGTQDMTLKSEVMWCQKVSSVFETGYHIGVQFVGHSVSQQLAIREYIEKISEPGN